MFLPTRLTSVTGMAREILETRVFVLLKHLSDNVGCRKGLQVCILQFMCLRLGIVLKWLWVW